MSSDTNLAYNNVLSINKLTMDISLGVGKKERAAVQKIIVDVRFYSTTPMEGFNSDDEAYLCYHTISQKIETLCTARPYKLVEYLTGEIYRLLRSEVDEKIKIWIKLTKPKIMPLPVNEGASFTYTDLPPHAVVAPQ